MKKSAAITLAALTLGLLATGLAAAQELEFPRVSPKAVVTQTVGTTTVTVTYCRPGVKNRVIWGGLVPYDKPWRTGANEATTIAFADPVQVEGQKLDAGTYSLLTIPGPEEWTVIFSKQSGLWGDMGYKPEEDALRVKVKAVPGEFVEWMTFAFGSLTDKSAVVELQWEKLRVPFKVEVDTAGKILAQARKNLGNYWTQPYRAANYCLNANTNLEEGLKWAQTSVAIQETYYNLALIARLQAKLGQKEAAIGSLEKALKLAKEMKEPPMNLKEMEALLLEWKR